VNAVGLQISNESNNNAMMIIYSDTVLLTVQGNDGESYDESFMYYHSTAIAGTETILAKFDPLGNVTLWIDGNQVASELLTAVWQKALTLYGIYFLDEASGSFEAWVSLTDPTPTPTPTVTPAATAEPLTLGTFETALIALALILIPAGLLGVLFRFGAWGFMLGATIGASLGYITLPSVVPLWAVLALTAGCLALLLRQFMPTGDET